MKAFVKNDVVVAISSSTPVGWSDLIEIELCGRKDLPVVGWSYDADLDKFYVLETTIPEYELGDIKLAAIKTVNDAVGTVRLSYIGDISNQFGIYTAKYQDAKAFKMKVFGENVADYLWIDAESSATGATPTEVAETFISNYSSMIKVFGRAEELRMFARDCINASETLKEVREAKASALAEIKVLHKK